MPRDQSVISIAVVFHNEQTNLSRLLQALEHVMIQDKSIELLLIDNNSRDESLAVAKWFKAAHPEQVNLHTRTENHLADARQDALLKAKHDRVAFVDADCWVPHDWLTKLDQAWGQFDGENFLAVAGANRAPYFAHGFYKALDLMQSHFMGNFGSTQACYSGEPSWVEHGSTCNLLIHRHRALAIGGYDSIFSKYAEDLDLSLRAQKNNYKIIFFPNIQVWHFHQLGYRAWFRKVFKYGKGQGLLCVLNPEILKTRRCLPLALFFLLAIPAMTSFISLKVFFYLSAIYGIFTLLISFGLCVRLQHAGYTFPVSVLMIGTQVSYTVGQVTGLLKGLRIKLAKPRPITVPAK